MRCFPVMSCLGFSLMMAPFALAADTASADRSAPAAESILDTLQKSALPDLIGSITEKKKTPKLRVVEIEGDVHDRRASRYLIQAYGEASDEGVRCKLIEGMGKLHDPALFDWFVRRLDDPHLGIQCFSIWALGELRLPKAAPRLRAKLWSRNAYVRWTAIDALGKAGPDPDTVTALILLLDEDDVQTRYLAAKALYATGGFDTASDLMNHLLKEPSLDVQEALARALGHTGGLLAVNRLTELLKNPPSPVTQHWVEIGLGSADPALVRPALEPLLTGTDERVKLSARRVAALLESAP